MKSIRTATVAALAVTAALLFTGCASDSGSSSDSSSGGNDCATLTSEVRDISNGAQNALNGDFSAGTDDAKAYIGTLSDRVDALEDDWKSDKAVTKALDSFDDSIGAAEDFIEAVPADGTVDPDAQATVVTGIQDSAAAVGKACSGK